MAPSAGQKLVIRTVLVFIALGVGQCFGATDKYCFQFTWVGPSYNKDDLETFGNTTCEEMGYPQPCQSPLVITEDGTPPNTTHMWLYQDRDQFTCKLTRSSVCIKWVYKYNGAVEMITYFCGKMTQDGKPVTNSCQKETASGYTTVACSCNDFLGIPCNSAFAFVPGSLISLFVMTLATVALQMALSRNCIL